MMKNHTGCAGELLGGEWVFRFLVQIDCYLCTRFEKKFAELIWHMRLFVCRLEMLWYSFTTTSFETSRRRSIF